MTERTTPPAITDDATYADVDNALMWLFTMSMNVAADPHRPARSRITLLLTACHAWDDIEEHRREWRLHDRLTARLTQLKATDKGFPKAGA